MTFYINKVYIDVLDQRHECIGLFSDTNWVGEGNFCGWYGAEFYKDVILLGYYTIPKTPLYKSKGERHIEEIDLLDEFDIRYEVSIGSCYWEQSFEEDDDYKALQRFFKEDF